VIEAGDGAEALALLARTNGRIGIVLSDVVMPRMGGKELDEVLWNRAPISRCSSCSAILGRRRRSEGAVGRGFREWDSGQGGIRTHDTLAGIPVFETGSFSHSDTCPWEAAR
jgi:hypothetical protein